MTVDILDEELLRDGLCVIADVMMLDVELFDDEGCIVVDSTRLGKLDVKLFDLKDRDLVVDMLNKELFGSERCIVVDVMRTNILGVLVMGLFVTALTWLESKEKTNNSIEY